MPFVPGDAPSCSGMTSLRLPVGFRSRPSEMSARWEGYRRQKPSGHPHPDCAVTPPSGCGPRSDGTRKKLPFSSTVFPCMKLRHRCSPTVPNGSQIERCMPAPSACVAAALAQHKQPGVVLEWPMATRDRRLAEFNSGPPPPGQQLQVLCEDHNGTYLLPFRCEWCEGVWYAAEKANPIEATVVGWREARR
jgi:hypothetical protein